MPVGKRLWWTGVSRQSRAAIIVGEMECDSSDLLWRKYMDDCDLIDWQCPIHPFLLYGSYRRKAVSQSRSVVQWWSFGSMNSMGSILFYSIRFGSMDNHWAWMRSRSLFFFFFFFSKSVSNDVFYLASLYIKVSNGFRVWVCGSDE